MVYLVSLQSRCRPGLASHLGRDMLPNTCICWQNSVLCDYNTKKFCFLVSVGQGFSSASIGRLQFYTLWGSSMAACFLKASKRVRGSGKMSTTVLQSVTHNHLSIIIYLPSPLLNFTVQKSVTVCQGEKMIQDCGCLESGIQTPLKICLP